MLENRVMVQKLIEKTFVLVRKFSHAMYCNKTDVEHERFHPLCLENLGSGV
jgi:hypothetical protein